jgi:tRNA G46 methylase TrmB
LSCAVHVADILLRHRKLRANISVHIRQLRTNQQDAELYDRSRPRYTLALFDDLATRAGLGPDSRVFEIGCATGQATVPIAKLGCSIVAA